MEDLVTLKQQHLYIMQTMYIRYILLLSV